MRESVPMAGYCRTRGQLANVSVYRDVSVFTKFAFICFRFHIVNRYRFHIQQIDIDADSYAYEGLIAFGKYCLSVYLLIFVWCVALSIRNTSYQGPYSIEEQSVFTAGPPLKRKTIPIFYCTIQSMLFLFDLTCF